MRLKDRVAIVVGAGQSPGEGIGNGRATALTFAREGAKVLCVDHNLDSAQETVDMIAAKGGTAEAFKADVTKNADLKAMVADALARWGKVDILHNNVGVSLSGGDAELLDITEEAFDRCVAINLKSCVLAAKHVIPIMRAQKSGAIINISSMAAITTYPYVAYKATKSAMIAFTEQLAYQNAPYGIRANVILPGRLRRTASRCSRWRPSSAASGGSTSRTATRTFPASRASVRASSPCMAASCARPIARQSIRRRCSPICRRR
jgi:NAD(P)-dependent dehydrogenase (short-subunit alcohol dehydrogenase family)